MRTPEDESRIAQRLSALKDKYSKHSPGEFEPVGPPIIQSSTVSSLVELYGAYDFDAPGKGDVLPKVHPYVKGLEQAQLFFLTIEKSDASIALMHWMKTAAEGQPNYVNAAAVGIGIVAGAFHTQLGPSFIDRFRNAKEPGLLESLPEPISFMENLSIIGNLKNPHIPEFQMHLNNFVGSYVTHYVKDLFEGFVFMGAGAMYQLLDKNWSRFGRKA